MLYPNSDSSGDADSRLSRRRMLAGGLTAGVAASAGCVGSDESPNPDDSPTVFVFNTGEGTVSLIDPVEDRLVETCAIGRSSSFPSNQFIPALTGRVTDSLWLNVGQGVQALEVDSLSETSPIETGSGANWLEQTPDGAHIVVSAREPADRQFRIDAESDSETFGEVTAEIDRRREGGRGDRSGPGPCDITVHPDGEYAYVPDIYRRDGPNPSRPRRLRVRRDVGPGPLEAIRPCSDQRRSSCHRPRDYRNCRANLGRSEPLRRHLGTGPSSSGFHVDDAGCYRTIGTSSGTSTDHVLSRQLCL